MLRQHISNLSRFTAFTLKYAASSTGNFFIPSSRSFQEDDVPSQDLIDFWVADTKRGLDALLDDQFDLAEEILSQHVSVSPFHAIGFALMAYVEAMFTFDTEKIKEATLRIAAAEEVARQLGKRVRGWRSPISTNSANVSSFDPNQPISISFASAADEDMDVDSCSTHSTGTTASSVGTVVTAPEEISEDQTSLPPSSPLAGVTSAPPNRQQRKQQQQQQQQQQPGPSSNKGHRRSIDLLCELIEVNCMLMSATIQFLGVSWIEYMKGTYRLRKAYKMYEHLFETVEGQKTSDYASILRKQKLKRRPQRRHAWGNSEIKRFSFFAMPTRKASVDHQRSSLRRRSFSSAIEESSTAIGIADLESESNVKNKNNTLQSGIFFGIGLFSLIFSLLPPKVNRILNTLGFHSSRPFALNVLQKSYESNGLYSSLSALTLLIYYTNLTLFIHPRLSPCSISPESARRMLTDMKVRYPNNKIWELLDGKLCKMEGKPRRGVEILRDSRRRRVDLSGRLTSKLRSNCFSLSELGQVQALAVYEMGWGQIFLGDYFQASETFFRLESINNWSRAFYHYIATCCMFANEQYDKASMEFHQIPNILERKRQLGGRLLPNEAFAERKIRRWREKAQRIAIETSQHTSISQHQGKDRSSFLDGHILKHVVEVNPLWELIYLWNGIPQLAEEMLNGMKECLEQCLLRQVSTSDKAILHLLFGTVMRELGDFEQAEKNLQAVLDRELEVVEDRWTIPYAMYELAALRCFCLLQQDRIGSQNISDIEDLVRRSEQYFSQRRGSNSGNNSNGNEIPYETSVVEDTHDWDSRLHIRCQLLLEKLDELKTNL